MAKMRNVDAFAALWERRTTLEIEGEEINLLGLPDLVRAKKTQREKHWPMIRRLVEAHWFKHRASPTSAQLDFWFTECRTPEILMQLAGIYPERVRALAESNHPRSELWRDLTTAKGEAEIVACLHEEMALEQAKDRAYWLPLKRELESLLRKING